MESERSRLAVETVCRYVTPFGQRSTRRWWKAVLGLGMTLLVQEFAWGCHSEWTFPVYGDPDDSSRKTGFLFVWLKRAQG